MLAERANEGLLTDDDQAEYEALINAADHRLSKSN